MLAPVLLTSVKLPAPPRAAGSGAARIERQATGRQAFHDLNIIFDWMAIQRLARALPARRTRARAPRLGREGRRAVRARAGDEHRRGRLTKAFGQRQGRRAKAAFGQRSANIPMRPSAARTTIDFILPIDGMIAAPRRIESVTFELRMIVPSIKARTCDESLGFNDKPIRNRCHHCATLLSRGGTGNPLWILTITLLFARRLLCAE